MKSLTEVQWKAYNIDRDPSIVLLTTELEYYKLGPTLGIVLIDNVDKDFSLVVLKKDRVRKTWRAVDLEVSLPTIEMAREKLEEKMKRAAGYIEDISVDPPMGEVYPEVAEMMRAGAEAFHRDRTNRCKNNGS